MAKDLRVEKRPEQVDLFMADGVVFEATVFLAQYAMYHSGEQQVLDLLLEDDAFLPAKAADGSFHLVRKGMIAHICCAVVLEEGLDYSDRQVKISFSGGEVLQGTVKIDMPAHCARLTDYLNAGNEFFPIFCESATYLVNRHLIRDVVLLD